MCGYEGEIRGAAMLVVMPVHGLHPCVRVRRSWGVKTSPRRPPKCFASASTIYDMKTRKIAQCLSKLS